MAGKRRRRCVHLKRHQLVGPVAAGVVADELHFRSQINSLPSSRYFEPRIQRATRRQDESQGLQDGADQARPPGRVSGVEPKAYRIRQVARLLNVPKSTAYDLVRIGALASV